MLLGVLLAIVIVVCIALVGVILLQRSEGGALGMSGGGPGNFMTTRGAGDLLTRTTQVLAAIFFILCLTMTIIAGHSRTSQSVVDQLKIKGINPNNLSSQPAAPSGAAPAANPAAPAPAPAPAGPAPSGSVGLFGEPLAPPKKTAPPRPAQNSANPLANIVQQTPAPAPAPAAPGQ